MDDGYEEARRVARGEKYSRSLADEDDTFKQAKLLDLVPLE